MIFDYENPDYVFVNYIEDVDCMGVKNREELKEKLMDTYNKGVEWLMDMYDDNEYVCITILSMSVEVCIEINHRESFMDHIREKLNIYDDEMQELLDEYLNWDELMIAV